MIGERAIWDAFRDMLLDPVSYIVACTAYLVWHFNQ